MSKMRGVDHISKLPEPILQKIMSLLLAKDAAGMSTLSKVCYSSWNSLSYLNFDSGFCLKPESDIQKFVEFVGQTLINRQKKEVSIHKFCIKTSSLIWCSYIHNNIHNWIETLVACNIKELILSGGGSSIFPEAIFAAKKLNVLDLHEFKLELPSDGIKLSSLRELKLSDTILNEQFVQTLCASCIGLECLTLANCQGLASLLIAGTLPKLRRVWLEFSCKIKRVDIVAPNLEYLDIVSNHKMLLKAIGITSSISLKSLNLNRVGVTDQGLEEIFSSIPNLETLNLFYCKAMKTMKISSDRLKCLAVSDCANLVAVELDTPNLTSLSYDCKYHQLPTLKLKASVLLEVVIKIFPVFNSQWHSKLMKFLGNINGSRAIRLVCYRKDAIVIPGRMRNDLGVDDLHKEYHCVVDILNSLLWISPQLDTLSFVRCPDVKSTLEFIYEDASDEDEKACCALLPFKCWRHHKLKEVKMENFAGMEQQYLRDYFSHRKVHIRDD